MIRSMTGFGGATTDVDGAHYAVEIRSLNNRYYKSQVRLPDALQSLEAEIDALVSRRLTRGSVVVTVHYVDRTAGAAGRVNVEAVRSYLDQLLEVPGTDHDATRIDMSALLLLPGVIIAETTEDVVDLAREPILEIVNEACDKLLAMRTREGEVLYSELEHHCQVIAKHLAVVEERAPDVAQQFEQRLRERMARLLAEVNATVRDEDLLREVAAYAEKTDLAEEIARLQGHLSQFQEIIDNSVEDPAGRTLDFLSQEMLREANTIASKCQDVEISRRIVEIKGAIDRVKEQAQNVE